MNETRIIEKFFQPLSEGFKGALNLKDDAAILDEIKADLIENNILKL